LASTIAPTGASSIRCWKNKSGMLCSRSDLAKAPGTTMSPPTSTAAGRAFFGMLAVFAEFETDVRRERQLEGITLAKRRGVYEGRKPTLDRARVKRLGSIMNDARQAGLIDWEAIEDRRRYLRTHAAWSDPADITAGIGGTCIGALA
jgi:Resolvase, N terminal domain